MGANVIGRYEVTGQLVAVSALSVSEGKDGLGADISCQRDGLGRLVIPGTAIAGCLRRIVSDPRWGGKPGDKKNAAVSRITTHDAPFVGDAEQLEVRDGVAIDRITGAAADRMLYAREVVAPEATFALSFSLDVISAPGDPQADGLVLVARLVRALEAGIAVGGSTTRGLGNIRLEPDSKVTWTPLADRESFLAYLAGGPTAVTLPKVAAPPRQTVTITIPWEMQSPLLVSVPFVGGVDAIPRHLRRADGVHLTLPGSSIKGVLRSHSERIVRTLAGPPVANIPDAPLAQFQQDIPLVSELFGRAPDSKGEGAWRGAVSCADVLSNHPLADWDTLVEAVKSRSPEARPKSAARVAKSPWLRVDDHVAISRWTGGSDGGKLFAWLAPWPGHTGMETWEPMRLTVDLTRLGANADSALMLLAYVLRDLCGGWLTFGHGTTRGYGEVTAETTALTFTWNASGKTQTLSDLFADESSAMVQAWQACTGQWSLRAREEAQR